MIVRGRYPDAAAFKKDMPNLLRALGFSPERADWLASRIEVDPSRGSGHAMGALRRVDNARLRTRIGKEGMDYKGFNIAVHELGHNVEQVFSLHGVPSTLLAGVPGNAFTEAIAFVFQSRGLEVLGLPRPDAEARAPPGPLGLLGHPGDRRRGAAGPPPVALALPAPARHPGRAAAGDPAHRAGADGPREDRAGEADLCTAVRAIIEGVDWPCEVQKEYSVLNLGCRNRISSGLDWVFQVAEEAIILEDDCLPHPDFFRFCETLLERYREDERVMMVGGTHYLLDKLDIRESFCFSRYFAIWGWATWRRAWAKYDLSMRDWPILRQQNQLDNYYPEPFMRKFVTSMFDKAYQGVVDTWDTQWFYTCLFNNGLSAVPRKNLVSNIGLDGTHTSRDISNHNFPVYELEPGSLTFPDNVFPNRLYDEVFFPRKIRRTLRMKVENRMHLLVSSLKSRAGV